MAKLKFTVLLTAALVASIAWAAGAAFIGTWKLNPAKSRLTDQMKVESAGPNRYAFDVGAGPELITVDGSDQPGYGGTTLAVSAEGPDAWKVVRKKDGRTLLVAKWSLSKDGNTLTDDFTSFGSDGSATHMPSVYARTAGTSGFAGTWESTSSTIDSVYEIRFRPYQSGGLALTYASGATKDITFDGQEHAPVGGNATQGITFSARKSAAGDLELTDKYLGKVVATERFQLSADGRTLTQTVSTPGKRTPNVMVFDRQ